MPATTLEFGRTVRREIHRDRSGLDRVFAAQVARQRDQLLFTPGNENQVVAVGGKYFCKFMTDTGRGACDQRGVIGTHPWAPSKKQVLPGSVPSCGGIGTTRAGATL